MVSGACAIVDAGNVARLANIKAIVLFCVGRWVAMFAIFAICVIVFTIRREGLVQ